jgi:hypothetical protein
LGAGASKGALLRGGVTPPLDAEFLDVSARHFARMRARGENRTRVGAWNSLKRHLKSAGLDFKAVRNWRLEQLSTFLEARANLRGMQLGRGRPRDYLQALEALKSVVCYTLQLAGGTQECELHKKLFGNIDPCAILTFNYDLIADQSLLSLHKLDWCRAEYRCATSAAVPTGGRNDAYIQLRSGQKGDSIPLLKLHGSMHYQKLKRGSGFRLAGAALPNQTVSVFDYQKVPDQPYIIPPIAAKIDIKQKALRERWHTALDHLHSAPAWIIWGYSFPNTDTISQVLFRTALTRNRKSKPVIVINPDSSVVQRVNEICRKVKVEHYPSMERFLMDHGVALNARR